MGIAFGIGLITVVGAAFAESLDTAALEIVPPSSAYDWRLNGIPPRQ
jgi:hypothetical protein